MSDETAALQARVNRIAAQAGRLIKPLSLPYIAKAVAAALDGDHASWDDAALRSIIIARADGAASSHFESLTSNLSPQEKLERGNELQVRKDRSAAPEMFGKMEFANEKERARIMALPPHLKLAAADEYIAKKRAEAGTK